MADKVVDTLDVHEIVGSVLDKVFDFSIWGDNASYRRKIGIELLSASIIMPQDKHLRSCKVCMTRYIANDAIAAVDEQLIPYLEDLQNRTQLQAMHYGLANSGLWTAEELFYSCVGVDDNVNRGVYFLLRQKTVVYVGQSTCIPARIKNHKTDKTKNFDAYNYILFDGDDEALSGLEAIYIAHFRPEYNVMRPMLPLYSLQGATSYRGINLPQTSEAT